MFERTKSVQNRKPILSRIWLTITRVEIPSGSSAIERKCHKTIGKLYFEKRKHIQTVLKIVWKGKNSGDRFVVMSLMRVATIPVPFPVRSSAIDRKQQKTVENLVSGKRKQIQTVLKIVWKGKNSGESIRPDAPDTASHYSGLTSGRFSRSRRKNGENCIYSFQKRQQIVQKMVLKGLNWRGSTLGITSGFACKVYIFLLCVSVLIWVKYHWAWTDV